MNPVKMLSIWRRFVGWWRSLFINIGLSKPIDAFKKIDDMVKIANDAFDQLDFPANTPTPPAPDTDDSPVPAPTPSKPDVGGRLRRLIEWLRRRKPEPKPEPTPPAPDDGGYQVW
jgi:hypothetical protein